jgi:predicted DNA-binding protein
MKRRSIHLGPSQTAKLAKRSKETGAPVAEIIRRAIDEYLAPRRPAKRAERKIA